MGGNLTLEEFGKNLTTFRFAVLRHELPPSAGRECHWDLLLETSSDSGANLVTFEVFEPPSQWVNHILAVKRLPDHRAVYLDYQGPISGDRGSVARVMAGTIEWKVQQFDLLVASVRQSWPIESLGRLHIAKLPGNEENRWEMQWQA